MEQRQIGSLTVSAVGLGCNNFGMRIDEAANQKRHRRCDRRRHQLLRHRRRVRRDQKRGVYGSIVLGARRDQIVLATKFGIKLDDDHPRRRDAGVPSFGGRRRAYAACRPITSTYINCTAPTTRHRSPTRSTR